MSGAFNGFWMVDGEFTMNQCDFSFDPDCVQIIHVGDMASIEGEDLHGTVDGNTLTIHVEETEGTASSTVDVVLVVANDGNSFTGTQTLTLTDSEFPEDDCVSAANISGTRTGDCSPQRPGSPIGFWVSARR